MVDINATSKTFALLGFTENDFLVYSAFLKYGEMSAAALARKIQMDKSSTYRATENLEANGLLVKHIAKKEAVYMAANPEVITELYSSKRSQIDILVDDLKRQGGSLNRSTYITVEKGIEALQFRMTESLESKEKVIRERFSDKFRYFGDKGHVKFVIDYAKERAKKEIKMLALEEYDWKVDNRFDDVMINTNKYFKELKRMPPDTSMVSNSLRIWDDTVNIISEDENKEFIIITIKDKFVVKLMKEMFDFMWSRSTVI